MLDVGIWSSSGGNPSTKKRSFSSTAFVAGRNTLTASGSRVKLEANTKYFVVLDVTSGASDDFRIENTGSADDPGAAEGWSVDDGGKYRNAGSNGGWSDWTQSRMIAVWGYVAAPAAPANPDPSNLARGAVQWEPVGAMHGLPTRMGEIHSNKPSNPTGSVDLSNIAASVREERAPHSRGFYLTTQVFGLGERSRPVRAGPDGSRYIEDETGQRYAVVSPGSLLLVKIWHVYHRPERGTNSIELLGDAFYPRLDNRLTEPVEVCLPAPARDTERVRIAVQGRLDSGWTVLATTLKDGQVCAETVRVGWLVLVLAPESKAA